MDYPVAIHIHLVVPTTFQADDDTDLQQKVTLFCNQVLPTLKQALQSLGEDRTPIRGELFGQVVARPLPQQLDS